MSPTSRLLLRAALSTAVAGSLIAAAAGPAMAANTVSKATAQAVNLTLLGAAATVAASPTPTTSTNDGTQTNTPSSAAPAVSALSGQSFLGAGALQETTEANKNGSSYACSGVLSPGSTIAVGSAGSSCTVQGNGTGGVTIDLKQVPGASALAVLGTLQLTIDALISHAKNTNGTASGGATIAGASLKACLPLNLTCQTFPLTIGSGVNANVLTAISDALLQTGNPLSAVLNPLSNALAPLISLQSNYQTTANGVLSVSALHASVVGNNAAELDLAKVTVGPNAPVAPVSMLSVRGLPYALGLLALLALAVIGVRRARATSRA